MGIFDAFSNPYKSSVKQAKKGKKDFQKAMAVADPFYTQNVNSGMNANATLADFFGLNGQGAQQSQFDNYSNGPGFQFMLDKSNQAIDQSAAARGMSQSGAALKALSNNTQGMYNQGLQQHYANLGGMQQGGFSGAQGLTNNANTLAGLRMQQGQAQDMNSQGAFQNAMGAIGTGASLLTGMPMGGGGGGFASMFGGGAGQMPTYGSGQVNPWAIY